MTTTIISSQRYIDDTIVASKIVASDFTVLVSPAFSIDGETYRVVLDGHHSLAAATEAGVAPDFSEATSQDHDAIYLLQTDPDQFLIATRLDSDYYDVATGLDVW